MYYQNLFIMKKVLLFCIALSLSSVFSAIRAQDVSGLSDKELSAQYKQQIAVLNSEIKTLKLKLKADKSNSELQSELNAKQATLKDVKSKKKIIDDAIKSKAASEKATKKAEKAQQDADKRAKEAQKLREG